MKFRVKVQDMKGRSWWENYDKQIGEANNIRGHGTQPEFTGDIQAWGIAIVDWYNKDVPKERKRRFLAAESLEIELKTRPVPKDADTMTVAEFRKACKANAFTDDDGHGFFCLNGATMTNIPAVPSQVVKTKLADLEGYGGVAWFNK